ncbi:hypothetical protein [Mycobacterium sp. KBS0706]|uniref:hypothetical protein n=1 Tax=Mycobacterium sp. KBS0706 TaxID=2578109 RepID=UPI00163D5F0B|nr:hypothetical protein [Mycobacterium sp. KBS0706]
MNIDKSEEMRSHICRVFIRRGGNGQYISLFEDLDSEKKKEIISKVKLGKMEMPVVGGIFSNNHWILLTTDRLIWCSDMVEKSVKIDEMRNASVNLLELKKMGQTKNQMTRLILKTCSGDEHSIEIEAGPPFSGLWNVLKSLGLKNQRQSNDQSPLP